MAEQRCCKTKADVSAGVCAVTAECEGEGLRHSVPVHDQKQGEPVCSDRHERPRSPSGELADTCCAWRYQMTCQHLNI